jgi:hypothetical protein
MHLRTSRAESETQKSLLSRLGKHKMRKRCLALRRLSDLDYPVLENLVSNAVQSVKRRYGQESQRELRGLCMRQLVAIAIAGVSIFAGCAIAEDTSAERSATARWMIEQAKAWAGQACGGKWVISDLLADDFKGTSPRGTRYEKPPSKPEPDPKTQWSTDCALDDADVRFFGADTAVMYGAESKTVALENGKAERRCLVWTDTWLRRNGKWQIIAVQDNRIDCPVK